VPKVAQEWSGQGYDLGIPVYVSTGTLSTVAHTGFSPEQVARVVIDVLARHNELITAPKLYFNGFTAIDFDLAGANPVVDRPAGITIQSADCQLLAPLSPTSGIHPRWRMTRRIRWAS